MHNVRTPDHLIGLAEAWQRADLLPEEFGPAVDYARRMHNRPLDYYLRRIRKLGLRGDRVLDAGSGTGTWSFALSAFFAEVISLDFDQGRTRAAGWLSKEFDVGNTHFARGDIRNIGLGGKTFDAVFCYGVLISHLPLRDVFAEFYRVLKPGGVLYVCLNGIGWSFYLRDERGATNPRDAAIGLDGIYNTLCQQNLAPVRQFLVGLSNENLTQVFGRAGSELKPPFGHRLERWVESRVGMAGHLRSLSRRAAAWAGLAEFRDVFRESYIRAWDQACTTLGGASSLLVTMHAIRQECGEPYVRLLARDVRGMALGRQADFSHTNAGRGYSMDEVARIVEEVGLVGFQWAHEGKIVGSPRAHDVEPIQPGMFNGHCRVWELIAFKPETGLGTALAPDWFIQRANSIQQEPLYAPDHSPFVTNVDKDSFSSLRVAEASRIAKAAGGDDFLRSLARRIVPTRASQEEQATALTQFVQRALRHHPVVQPFRDNGSAVLDPATLLFLHVGRCGAAASLLAAMLNEVGIEAQVWQVLDHLLTTASVDGREVVLEADYFKGGLMLRDDAGKLLSKQELLMRPQIADHLPSAVAWEVAAARRHRDLWGREVRGYLVDQAFIRIYSSHFTDPPTREYLPTIPVIQASRSGDRLDVEWAEVTNVNGEPITYDVWIGTASRGWSYERAQSDAAAYFCIAGGDTQIQRTAECLAIATLKDSASVYVTVRPILLNRPDVFCWPSEEVRVP